MSESTWVVVISKPMNEDLAEKSIREAGYRSYLPRYRKVLRGVRIDETGRRIRSRQSGEIVLRPLFPRYLFAELYPNQQWRAILSASGVMDFIWRGERPASLTEGMIELIRQVERDGEFDEARPESKQGRADLEKLLHDGKTPLVRVPEWNDKIGRLTALHGQGKAVVWLFDVLGGQIRATVKAQTLEVVDAA